MEAYHKEEAYQNTWCPMKENNNMGPFRTYVFMELWSSDCH